MDETIHGTGCIPIPPEIQARHYRLAAAAPPIIDWSVPYMVPATVPMRDQDGSSSCTGQATRYYGEVLNRIENQAIEDYSARHIYSQVFLPGGGAYIASAMSVPLKQGYASLASVPEGNASEAVMTDGSENVNAVLEARADKYAVIPRGSSIDALAQIIRDYHGFITGFSGHNGSFDSKGMVVDWSHVDWSHAVYVCGYRIRSGKKCLVFKNSWGPNWGDHGYGYFPEEFVGNLFDAYTYAAIEDLDPLSMNRFVRVKDGKDVWVVRDGKRSLVLNSIAMKAIGDFSQVQEIKQEELNAIPDTGTVVAGFPQE